MKLGIGLPTTLVPELNRGLFLDWARTADQAGFHVFGTLDQPGYDSWDPLVALAAAAAVTERVRLSTTILQLPNRNEVLVAKQAAVIDRLSGGRLDLGVAPGARESDFKALGVRFQGRGRKFERQVRKIRRVWRSAKRANADAGATGPAPMQKPLPPIWIGAHTPKGIARAIDLGDSFIFGAAGPSRMAQAIPQRRAAAEQAAKKNFLIAGIAYCAVGDDPAAALEQGAHHLLRYYGGSMQGDPADRIHHGPPELIAAAVEEYERAGLDVLILFPQIPDVKQVEQIAEHVLPRYRIPSH